VTAVVEPQGGGLPFTSGDAAVSLRGVSKTYGLAKALDDISFEMIRGKVHALLGGNGCGKSTLIKILAGVVTADPGGRIGIGDDDFEPASMTPEHARDLGLRFVHQDLGVFTDLTVAENMAIGAGFPTGPMGNIHWKQVDRNTRELLDRYNIRADPGTVLHDLRPADRTMVAIARALQDAQDDQPMVLVLDEPTAWLPAGEVNQLLDRIRSLREHGHTVMLVTHRLTEALETADNVTILRDGHHVETRHVEGLDEGSLARLIVGRSVEVGRSAPSDPAQEGAPPVLQVEHLSGGPIEDVSFSVRAGEIVGLAGLLGSGRTEILDMLSGSMERTRGTVRLLDREVAFKHPADAINAGIAHLPEDRLNQASFPDLSITDNFTAPSLKRFFRPPTIRRNEERAAMSAAISGPLEIKASGPDALMWTLSGGNQQKVVVGRWLATAPKLLLLDEPSQGVDVGARQQIHGMIRQSAADGMAVLVVTSDFEELAQLAQRVLVLGQGRITNELTGGEITPDRCYELAGSIGRSDG